MRPIPVLGAGLAGSEAAWQLAEAGWKVELFEMRPVVTTPAHQTEHCAELVCSNSLGSMLPNRAGGVLQAELKALGCHLLMVAEVHAVPAGNALAVDRDAFAADVTRQLEAHPRIQLRRQEVKVIPEGPCIVATGPLTSPDLADHIEQLAGTEHLAFFDAISPVVTAESLDRKIIFPASRWQVGNGDYLNVPLNRQEYETFVEDLLGAEKHQLKDFESQDPRAKIFFERCLPIEILAQRGVETLRFGPMRPVGLFDPQTGKRPYAVIQLRMENQLGTLFNLVGFQTNLKYEEQKRVLRKLPGLKDVQFARLGSMHRNTFLNSPQLLTSNLEWKTRPGLCFAGQITGMEGYLGNVASGLIAARTLQQRLQGNEPHPLPINTLIGALTHHVAHAPSQNFQPMKAEFGLLPPLLEKTPKKVRGDAYAARSADELTRHLHNVGRPNHPPNPLAASSD